MRSSPQWARASNGGNGWEADTRKASPCKKRRDRNEWELRLCGTTVESGHLGLSAICEPLMRD